MGTKLAATWGIILVLAVGAGVLAYVALKPDHRRGTQQIMQVEVLDPTTLRVMSPSCNGDPEVTVTEDGELNRVYLSLVATVYETGPMCADMVDVTLEKPLGDRLVVDAKGNVLPNVVGG
ncbi:hypothetical protein [Demequina soli]|uniref:hypothetical protein n=1 Tax=Demequina soli TaxID=1638987 RepID=UPI0007801DF3|nr:hypothetical protein [Demequina soli]